MEALLEGRPGAAAEAEHAGGTACGEEGAPVSAAGPARFLIFYIFLEYINLRSQVL
jgi:hypothetical protein